MIIIANPAARHGKGKKLVGLIESELRRQNIDYILRLTSKPGDAAETAREAAFGREDMVLCIGGDGTVSEVAGGIVGTETVLGIIPAGTGDDFARYLGIPKNPLKALETALRGTPRAVDAVKANDRYFINVAGSGFDVSVLKRTLYYKKVFSGLTAYVLGVLSAVFGYRYPHITLETDSVTASQEVILATVANGRYFGGGMCVASNADASDGLLDVHYVDAVPRWKIPLLLTGFIRGDYTKWPIAHHLRCKELTVTASDESFQLDGEIFTGRTVHYKILPGAVRIMVPVE